MGALHEQAGGVPEIPKYFVRSSTKYEIQLQGTKFRLQGMKSELQVEFARYARGLLVGLRQDAREVFRGRRDGDRARFFDQLPVLGRLHDCAGLAVEECDEGRRRAGAGAQAEPA